MKKLGSILLLIGLLANGQVWAAEVHKTDNANKVVATQEASKGPVVVYYVKNLEINGGGKFDFQWLKEALAKDLPRKYTLDGLIALQTKANELLKARGYVTTKAEIKNQNLGNGTLVLTVIPGIVKEIEFNKPGYYNNALLFSKDSLLDINKLRNTISNLEQSPNRKVSASFKEAKDGGSIVIFNIKENKPYSAGLSIDNYGDKETGEVEGNIWLQKGNLAGISDSLYLSYNKNISDVPGATDYIYGSYGFPLGNTYFTYTYQKNYSQQLEPLRFGTYKSRTKTYYNNFQWRQTLAKNLQGKTELIWSLKHKVRNRFINNDELINRREQTTSFDLGYHRTKFLGASYVDTSLTWRKGLKMRSKPNSYYYFMPGATNYYNMYIGSIYLWAPLRLTSHYEGSYTMRLRGQYTTSPLYSGDYFTIGGWYNVRGFNGDYNLSGENGFMIRNEIQLPLPKARKQQIYLGLDYGKVTGPYTKYLIGRELAGAAIGIRGGSKGFDYDLFWATPLSQPNGLNAPKNLWGFSVDYNW